MTRNLSDHDIVLAIEQLQSDVRILAQYISDLRKETQKAFDDRYERTKEAVDVLADQDKYLDERLGEIERLPIINLLKEGARNDDEE
jgi:hypothetical protein